MKFSEYLDNKDPDLLNEINLLGWINTAKDEAKKLFGDRIVSSIAKNKWIDIAKKLAQGGVLTAGMLGTVDSSSGQEYKPNMPNQPVAKQSVQKQEIKVNDPEIEEIDVNGTPVTKISFKVQIPKYMLSPEKGAARSVKFQLLNKFKDDTLMTYNPYNTVRVSINGKGVPFTDYKDLLRKTLNPQHAGLDNFKFEEDNKIIFFIPVPKVKSK